MKLAPDDRLLMLDEVQRLVPYSKVHLYRLIKRGDFPKQLRIGPARVAWRESDILKWLEQRIDAPAA